MKTNLQVNYIFWEALFKFIFPKNDSFYEAPVSLGPFDSTHDFMVWRDKFLQAIKEKVDRMPNVQVKILKEDRLSQPVEFLEEAEEDGFVAVACLTPDSEGRYFSARQSRSGCLISTYLLNEPRLSMSGAFLFEKKNIPALGAGI